MYIYFVTGWIKADGNEIQRSLTACKLVIVSLPISGVVTTLIGLVVIFDAFMMQDIEGGYMIDLTREMLFANLAVSLIPILYGLVIDLFILPFACRLKVMDGGDGLKKEDGKEIEVGVLALKK